MKRFSEQFLTKWLKNENTRKPLVLRGARQVGKTWLVRHLAKHTNKLLIELNFEKQPELSSLFESNDVNMITKQLAAKYNTRITPENSLLFLDEIQAAPQLLAKLRWFAEDMPELPVVAAGSLLEFTLTQHDFSMPVGRINYMHLEPLSFEEFLHALGQTQLLNYLAEFTWNQSIPAALHTDMLRLYREYMFIGGMPSAVSSWHAEQSTDLIHQIHLDLLATYRDDFAKYAGKLPITRLEDVMSAVPRLLGKKFVYKHVNKEAHTTSIRSALQLLEKAKLCYRIHYSTGNGIPLATESLEKNFKISFLDTGLACTSLGLQLYQLNNLADLLLINQGSIAEQSVAQALRTLEPPYVEPSLYYWAREEKQSSAEIDYLIQDHDQLIPIEVKAGSTGSLRSLHVFMASKPWPLAIRVNSDLPSRVNIDTKTQIGKKAKYRLLSIPFYLVGQLRRLITLDKT